jgi:hypothetical protein
LGNKTYPVDNITSTTVREFFSRGYTFMNFINGSTSVNDKNTVVYFTGRNPDSGTRLNALLAAFWGKFTGVTSQVVIGGGGSGGNITSLAQYPAATINGVPFGNGNNGYGSGSSIVSKLNSVIPSTVSITAPIVAKGSYTNYLVSYAGVGDYAPTAGTGVKVLKYNGIQPRCFNTSSTALDQGYTNIITGAYPFWTVVNAMYNPSHSNATAASAFIDVVCATNNGGIRSLESTNANMAPNIKLSDMKVTRSDDGITPVPTGY